MTEPHVEQFINSVKVDMERVGTRDEYALVIIGYTDIPGVSAYWDGTSWVQIAPWDKIEPAFTLPGKVGSLVSRALHQSPDSLGEWYSDGIPEAFQNSDGDFSYAPPLDEGVGRRPIDSERRWQS